ncbi:E3 ubiquitin-protein ligase TRIM41, partial [Galemys pyrenaicus]
MAAIAMAPKPVETLQEEVVWAFMHIIFSGSGHFCHLWRGEGEEGGIRLGVGGRTERSKKKWGLWGQVMGGMLSSSMKTMRWHGLVQLGQHGLLMGGRGHEDLDYYLGDKEEDLRGEVNEEGEKDVLEEDEEELDPNFPKVELPPHHVALQHGIGISAGATLSRMIHVNYQGILPTYQEALKLFCKVGEEAICVMYRESRSHKYYSIMPLENYKTKLQGYVEPAMRHLEAVQKTKTNKERCVTELKRQMKSELEAVAFEFGQLSRFLLTQGCMKSSWGVQRTELPAGADQGQGSKPAVAAVGSGGVGGCKKYSCSSQRSHLCQPHSQDFLTVAVVRKMSSIFCQA